MLPALDYLPSFCRVSSLPQKSEVYALRFFNFGAGARLAAHSNRLAQAVAGSQRETAES